MSKNEDLMRVVTYDDGQFRTEVGFNMPTDYQIEKSDTAFHLALAIFGTSIACATVLGAQIVGLL